MDKDLNEIFPDINGEITDDFEDGCDATAECEKDCMGREKKI